MAKETVLSNLNVLTFKTQKGFQNHVDEIGEFDLVLTPDQSLKGNLFDFKWADHILNDVSWLRADTFSWHSGDVYVAAYNHLADDIDGATAEIETIGDITITYYRAEDSHKICLPDQEAKISALYEQTGAADYYLLDTTNKQFKLPRKYRPKRELVRSAKNYDGAWYNLYSDGWVEQGGMSSVTATTSDTITLPIEMSDTNYTVMSGLKRTTNTGGGHSSVGGTVVSTTQIKLIGDYNDGGTGSMQGAYWQVCGYAAQVPAIKGNAFEYYYVGYFEQDAIEQTAGINAEMFNAKADVNLMNTASNVDIVIESQLPTADNGHTWYRKYKSGWVEQGGELSGRSVTFPVEFAQKPTLTIGTYSSSGTNIAQNVYDELTTTGFTGFRVRGNAGWDSGAEDWNGCWQASGMAA